MKIRIKSYEEIEPLITEEDYYGFYIKDSCKGFKEFFITNLMKEYMGQEYSLKHKLKLIDNRYYSIDEIAPGYMWHKDMLEIINEEELPWLKN